MKYVLFYESGDDVATDAPPHHPAHSARLQEFHARGDLLMVGTFGDPRNEGSMSIFTSRKAAEEFAKDDPFVLNNVVRTWYVGSGTKCLPHRRRHLSSSPSHLTSTPAVAASSRR